MLIPNVLHVNFYLRLVCPTATPQKAHDKPGAVLQTHCICLFLTGIIILTNFFKQPYKVVAKHDNS
jgi:hypothetical protein